MLQVGSNHLYLVNRLLCSPLEAMFPLLIFILSKEGGATPLQLSILAASKPIVSLLAFYLSSSLLGKPQKVKQYLVLVHLLGCLPCFWFSFFDNNWFYIGAFALFTTTCRASFPPWAEILKVNVGLSKMGLSISRGTSIHYAILLTLPILSSFWMDQNPEAWKTIFLSLAVLQLTSSLVLFFSPIHKAIKPTLHLTTAPLREAWGVLKKTPPFAKYLWMYFLGGAGIVAMQSILPIYFNECLGLSYTQLTLAFSFCKGVSFVLASPIWAHYVNQATLYLLNAFINLFTCLFIGCLFASSLHVEALFSGYLFSATMQAGSELSWNMSGPIFSQAKESTLYSSLNLILVGIRGCICPFIGQLLYFYSGFSAVFFVAFILCLISLFYALKLDRIYKHQPFVGA